MKPALTPVQTTSADRPSFFAQAPNIQTQGQKIIRPGSCKSRHWVRAQKASLTQGLEKSNGLLPSEMIVADPCLAQSDVARPCPHPLYTGSLRKAHQGFEHVSNIGSAQADISVTSLFDEIDQPGLLELGQMTADRLRRDVADLGQFGGRQGTPIHQRLKHVGTRRIADQGSYGGNGRSDLHSSIITEA